MKKRVIYYISVILAIFSFLWLLKVLFLGSYPDFAVNYFSAQHVLHGENPFLIDKRYFTQQVYPPFVPLFFIPFTFFQYNLAGIFWTILSIIELIIVIFLLCRVYAISFLSKTNLLLMTLVFISFPLKFTLGMGQINILILLFVGLSYYFLHLKRNYLSGFFLAFPVLLKFFPLLLIPYLIYIKKWKILLSFFITICFLSIITIIFISFPVVMHYIQFTLPNLLSSWKGDYYNQSLSGLLMRGISDTVLREQLRICIAFIFICLTAGIIFLQKKRTTDIRNLEISAILVVSILINNFSWQHHFILLLLSFFITYFFIKKRKLHYGYYCILGLSYMLIAVNIKDPSTVPILFQSHVFIGGLLLYLLHIYLLIRNIWIFKLFFKMS